MAKLPIHRRLRNSKIKALSAFKAKCMEEFYTRTMNNNSTKSKWLNKVYEQRRIYKESLKYFNSKLNSLVEGKFHIFNSVGRKVMIQIIDIHTVIKEDVYVNVFIIECGIPVKLTVVKFTDIYEIID